VRPKNRKDCNKERIMLKKPVKKNT
jgi:hypothetical protein